MTGRSCDIDPNVKEEPAPHQGKTLEKGGKMKDSGTIPQKKRIATGHDRTRRFKTKSSQVCGAGESFP